MFAWLPLSFLNWAYVRQGVYLGAYATPEVSIIGVFRTPITKPSDFQRNLYIDSIE